MPWHPKTASTTAPNATECQSFLDNLVAGLPTIRASDYWVGTSAFGGKADMTICGRMSAFVVAIGGKADMGLCTANVRF